MIVQYLTALAGASMVVGIAGALVLTWGLYQQRDDLVSTGAGALVACATGYALAVLGAVALLH